MLIEAFVSLPSAEGAVQERNGSLMRNYSHLFDYHHEDHNTKPGRTSSNWTRDELRSPLLLSERVTGISKSLSFHCLGPNVLLLPSSREWALERFWGCLIVKSGVRATLQKDSPDLVRRLEPASPTLWSGDTFSGSSGQAARARGLGVRLARDHSGAPGTPRARPGCRSQAPPSAGLRGSPPAPWRAITGQGSAPRGLGGGAAPALGESHSWRVPTGSPRAKQGLLLTPQKSAFHR